MREKRAGRGFALGNMEYFEWYLDPDRWDQLGQALTLFLRKLGFGLLFSCLDMKCRSNKKQLISGMFRWEKVERGEEFDRKRGGREKEIWGFLVEEGKVSQSETENEIV